MEDGEFYKEQTWRLLISKIDSLQEGQEAMVKDIEAIKNKISWIIGIATGVTFIINVLWQWIKVKISRT